MVFDFYDLYEAYKTESLGKRNTANHYRYTYNLEDNLYRLMARMNNKQFKPSPLQLKDILYPKRRVAQIPSKEDKIVQHAICDYVVYDLLVSPLLPHSSANCRGRGTDYALRLLKNHFVDFYRKRRRPPYILKCDIKSFFRFNPARQSKGADPKIYSRRNHYRHIG